MKTSSDVCRVTEVELNNAHNNVLRLDIHDGKTLAQ